MLRKIIFSVTFLIFITSSYAQKQTTSADFSEPFKIAFNNFTSKTVWVAVRYKTTSGSWRTKYWFKYKPYEKDKNNKTFVIKTFNRYFYYFARTKSNYNGSYSVWKGRDNYRKVDGKQVGMKEIYLSKSIFSKPRGQTYYIDLK
ncbi:hypothetical protein [Polaribacter marinivivus]|uniref:Uncharacterized protein n=1 Tax=Polaribacter marinivivus TaxID=1524260 RepID=A0ABV8RAA1_9FLAO